MVGGGIYTKGRGGEKRGVGLQRRGGGLRYAVWFGHTQCAAGSKLSLYTTPRGAWPALDLVRAEEVS